MGKLYLGPEQVMTGATSLTAGSSGLVPEPAIGDQDKFLRGDGTWAAGGSGGGGATFLEYGYSTWDEFIAAYNAGQMVCCRAAEGTTPGIGELTRTAPMIGVNDEDSPTQVEFLYYKSDSTHSAAQQTDQVYVYKLNSYDLWSVSVRNVGTPVAAGTGIGVSYSNNTLTINNTAALPSAESTDEGKFLRVVNGVWAAATVPSAVGVNF